MSVMQAAAAHFRAIGIRSIEVPEWIDPETGNPVVIYFDPLTGEEHAQVMKVGREPTLTELIDLIVIKARTEDGKKMFTIKEKVELKKFAVVSVLGRIAAAMLAMPDEGSVEKN